MSEHICKSYLVSRAETIIKLEEEVNMLMENGWRPLGPIVFGNSIEPGHAYWFFQTMIRGDA